MRKSALVTRAFMCNIDGVTQNHADNTLSTKISLKLDRKNTDTKCNNSILQMTRNVCCLTQFNRGTYTLYDTIYYCKPTVLIFWDKNFHFGTADIKDLVSLKS